MIIIITISFRKRKIHLEQIQSRYKRQIYIKQSEKCCHTTKENKSIILLMSVWPRAPSSSWIIILISVWPRTPLPSRLTRPSSRSPSAKRINPKSLQLLSKMLILVLQVISIALLHIHHQDHAFHTYHAYICIFVVNKYLLSSYM